MKHTILNAGGLKALCADDPNCLQYRPEGGVHVKLTGVEMEPVEGVDEERIASLARVIRGLTFAAVDGGKSGHPGGSSSKTEQALTLLLSGVVGFDATHPKHRGRDRIVWSAGHCSPLFHSLVSLVYDALRRKGVKLSDEAKAAVVYPEELARFRKYDGPSGHVESHEALADIATGSSGHGFSSALGFATLHRSCGLPTKVFVLAGDAETEEGMSYEARNISANIGGENIIVSLDFNGYGIDGPITEVLPSPYLNHWFASGWNMIEVDGHNVLQLAHAYKKAVEGFGNGRPTVVVCHTIKGKHYGKLEGSPDSHGMPLPHDEYVGAMQKLAFNIPGKEGETAKDIEVVMADLKEPDIDYLVSRLEEAAKKLVPEKELVARMETALKGRALQDHTTIKRPDVLPPELLFKEGDMVPTRKATEAWFEWMMKRHAFFYIGSGDLMKSILTGKAEQVYGIINKDNPLGRGMRFGIAEQNMAMFSAALSQDVLPGGFRPMSVFSTYGVFTSMMANSVRMALINNAYNPDAKGFFIMLAAHDGPETGEDGPTHHGLYWMSLFTAYPGIKVYKPLDANETIEMLFYAAERGEPVAFSVVRPPVPVLKRGNGVPPAHEAVNGAYVFKQYTGNGKKKLVLVVSGGQVMANVLEVLPDIEKEADVKIVAVTSPQLYEEYCEKNPAKAKEVLSAEDRKYVVTLHNGWEGFLYQFMLPADYRVRAHGMRHFLKSGSPKDIYVHAGFDPSGVKARILGGLQ